MTKLNKLVFFGNERLATAVKTTAPTLRGLVAAGYEIEAVIASHIDGVSRQKRDLEIGLAAQSYDIPVILPGEKISLVDKLKRHQTEAAVLVAYGRLIPQNVIDLFPKGIINIHPSLLPAYRGSTPIESAILDGARQTGVSLMKLTSNMDAGPVFARSEIKLRGNETKQALANKLSGLGAELLVKELPKILDGSKKPSFQNDKLATYTKLIKKDDGLVSFAKPAKQLEREVRAYFGWPKSRSEICGQDVIITRARIAENESDGALVMKCKPGWLEILELIAPSGRKISGADFVRGYKH